MKEAINDFLRQLRGKMSLREASKKSGLSHTYISALENNKRPGSGTPINPTPETLKRLSSAYDYSYEELLIKAGYLNENMASDTKELISKGYSAISDYQLRLEKLLGVLEKEGIDESIVSKTIYETFNSNNIKIDKEELYDHPFKYKEKISSERKVVRLTLLLGALKMLSTSEEILVQPHILRVPLVGTIPAGKPILAEEYIEEFMEIPNIWNLKDGEVFVLKVKGDSMTGSRIYDGDRVIVKIQPDVENGEIAVVNVNRDDATLKRVKKINGQVILYPDNPKYSPIFPEDENARIIGKVVQVMFEPKRF